MTMNELPNGKWAIDPARSSVQVSVKNFAFLTVTGTLDVVSGTIEIVDGAVAGVVVEVDASSYTTGNAKRDEHVGAADFLDAANHSMIGFSASTATSVGTGYRLDGTVQVKGLEEPMSLTVAELKVTDDSASFSATGAVDRNVIGLDKMPSFIIGDELTLEIDATAELS